MSIVNIELGSGSDIDGARTIVTDLAKAHPLVREIFGCPVIEPATSSVVLRLRASCRRVGDAGKVPIELYEQAMPRFDAESIGPALRQMCLSQCSLSGVPEALDRPVGAYPLWTVSG